MARKIVHQLVDDLDGTVLEPGEGESVIFSVDGKSYEIDLTEKHATTFVTRSRRTFPPAVARAGAADRRRSADAGTNSRDFGAGPCVGEEERLHRLRPRPRSGDDPRGVRRRELTEAVRGARPEDVCQT